MCTHTAKWMPKKVVRNVYRNWYAKIGLEWRYFGRGGCLRPVTQHEPVGVHQTPWTPVPESRTRNHQPVIAISIRFRSKKITQKPYKSKQEKKRKVWIAALLPACRRSAVFFYLCPQHHRSRRIGSFRFAERKPHYNRSLCFAVWLCLCSGARFDGLIFTRQSIHKNPRNEWRQKRRQPPK